LFAGLALKGATLRPDNDTNKELYGRKIEGKEILMGDVVKPPAAAHDLIAALSKYSFREAKDKPR
jgi:lipid-binding SYLF domain-containing protein